jgi:hypothetical protein
MNRNLLIIFLLLCLQSATAQSLSRPKTIKEKGDYVHKATGTIFPVNVGSFQRTKLSTFDKQKNDVDASYELDCPGKGKTIVTVYVFPGREATDSRFRDNFLAAVLSVSYNAGRELQDKYTYCPYTSEGYKINGFRASFIPDKGKDNWLELYECGKWLLKIRTTTDCLDSAEAIGTSRQFAAVFNPVKLLQSSQLALKPHIAISKEAFFDSLFLGCTIARALKEATWAQKNVDSLERTAGFPGLHLDMHIAGIEEFVHFADTNTTMPEGGSTREFLDIYRSLKQNNLLAEFIMMQKSEVMIVPEDRVFNFHAYNEWEKTHKMKEYINTRFYENSYEESSVGTNNK